MGMVDKLSDLKNKSIPAPNLIIIAGNGNGNGIVKACGVGLLLLYGGHHFSNAGQLVLTAAAFNWFLQRRRPAFVQDLPAAGVGVGRQFSRREDD